MTIGVRQRLIVLILIGLFVTMGLVGTYRYWMEKRDIIASARVQAERSNTLLAELAARSLLTSDFSSVHYLAERFMKTADAQEIAIVDREGRQIVLFAKPVLEEKRILAGPHPIVADTVKLGDIRIAVYPADMELRLRAVAQRVFIEQLVVFLLLSGMFFFLVPRLLSAPVKELESALKEVIARGDLSLRVEAHGNDGSAGLADNVNDLIVRLERATTAMGAVSARIAGLGPLIESGTREIRQNSEVEATAVMSVSSSVSEMSSSIRSISESAESLSSSAEETSSAILEMNASNQEVARHIGELTTSVEDVTTSVSEMIGSIYEVAGHVESLSSAADETSASALQIEATVREVEQAAKESSKLSQQVSREARDIGVRSIQETKSAIDTIKDAVERYSDLVTRLGKRSEEIGKILGVIVEVTERTNLLALNASILAAQAGEHGRGFAVVAEEIKALAERTSGSAHDITKLVTAVQKETKEAVAAMTDSLSAVEAGVERSQEAGVALDKILASSSRSAEMASMIERAMAEQGRGIKQVSEAITNVKQMTSHITAATQAQTKGTERILGSAEGMRDIARRVRISMDEQGRGGKQIAAAAENVTMRAGAIATGTREQQQAIRQTLGALEQVQDLPHQNIKHVEELATALKVLGDEGKLLDQEATGAMAGEQKQG